MGSSRAFSLRLENGLIEKLDKRCKDLGVTRNFYIAKLIEGDFYEAKAKVVTQGVEKELGVTQDEGEWRSPITGRTYSETQTLPNGVKMPGTYVPMGDYTERWRDDNGNLIKK